MCRRNGPAGVPEALLGRGPGGRSPPGKSCATQRDIDRTEPIDGTEGDGERTDRTEYLPDLAPPRNC
eukprot:13322917-Alexandrium_andersonii.AAC.1